MLRLRLSIVGSSIDLAQRTYSMRPRTKALVDRVLRAVLDGGYERGGSIDRAGEEFLIYFPCAYALRGEMRDVPSAVLSRSHIVNMQLGTPRRLFGRNDRAFSVARELIAKWRATVSLNLDPWETGAKFDQSSSCLFAVGGPKRCEQLLPSFHRSEQRLR